MRRHADVPQPFDLGRTLLVQGRSLRRSKRKAPARTALDRAREIARKLAAKSPIVMKIGRDAFMRAVDADFRRSVENAAESFALVATTEDCQEGLNAFVEKRTPSYKGR